MPTSNPPDPKRLVAELSLQEALELGTFASQESMNGSSSDTCIGDLMPPPDGEPEEDNDD